MNNLLNHKTYDAIINIGGSIFMQNPAWRMRLEERKYLLNKFKTKKSFIIGANFGPYEDDRFLEKYRQLFKHYDDVCFRDSYSYNLFKDLDNVRLAPDIVFNYETFKNNSSEKVIGFSIINLKDRIDLRKYSKRYRQKLVQLIEKHIKVGYRVKLFSFCENEGDLEGINDIFNKLKRSYKKDVKIINYTGDIDSFLVEFNTCQKIIGSRLHSLILAMLFNKDFYPLIYSDKTIDILNDFEIKNKGCHIKDINQLSVVDVFESIKDNKLTKTSLLLNAVDQFKKLDEFILGEIKSEKEAFICD